jgi:hypothetical protein
MRRVIIGAALLLVVAGAAMMVLMLRGSAPAVPRSPVPRSPDVEEIPDRFAQMVVPKKVESVSRFPTMEAPDQVAVGKPFVAQISLTEEQVTPDVKVAHGKTTADGKLELPLPAGKEGWDLEVVLSAPAFTLDGGANSATIHLPKNGDSTVAAFHLTAKPIASAREEVKLYATLWHEGAYLAKLVRPIVVTAVTAPAGAGVPKVHAQAAPETLAPPRAVSSLLPLQDRAPDLTLYLTHGLDPANPRAAQLIVVSPHLSPSTRAYALPPQEGLGEVLQHEYALFAGATPRGVALPGARAAGESKEATIALVRGFGLVLFQQFAPAPFKEVYFRLRDQLGDRFQSMQVITDDPTLPWELMRPQRGPEERDFLGVELALARWHVGQSTTQLDRPPQALALDQIVAIAPKYKGELALPHQADELNALAALGVEPQVSDGSVAATRELFRSAPRGIVHFAGHGVVKSFDQHAPEYVMRLADGELDLMTWRGLRGRAADAHPLLFWNACELGEARRVAGFVEGWAPAALDAGASGYIGGLWPLGDRGAADFARRFYGSLARSAKLVQMRAQPELEPVAVLLREARKGFYETGDPTYLAYVYYGDPLFRLTR